MSGILSIFDRVPVQTQVSLGDQGEAIAAEFLVQNGFRLVAANFKVPVGRNSKGVQVTGEIDIIALEGETLCFVEVKTRRSADFTPVLTNVNLRKQRQIIRTAKVYRRIFNLYDMDHRFDVVTVLMPKHVDPVIELTRSYWTENKFRKKYWVNTGGDHF